MPAKDTTKLLSNLRMLMKNASAPSGKTFSAYIIPSSDAHGSEYLSETDKRRQFISGFSGSAGTAVVTDQTALLWTDGRYFLQASQELDANWQLMKDGLAETPSIGDWLVNNLPKSSTIGIDATLYEDDLYSTLSQKLNENKFELVHSKQNLVDLVWSDKPVQELKPLIKLNIDYCGRRTRDKFADIRQQMTSTQVGALVVTSLDEIAWLLNMRGFDIPYGTVFFAYLIVTTDQVCLFTNTNRLDQPINSEPSTFRQYLLAEDGGFQFFEYDQFYHHLEELARNQQGVKIYLSSRSNHYVHSLVPGELVHKDLSLIAKTKIIKNVNEIESAKRVHVRDSVALVEFFCKLDRQYRDRDVDYFGAGELDEYTLADLVDKARQSQLGFLTSSFETICSIGPNGAIIHYKPKQNDAMTRKIEPDNVVLIDSGGHYVDMGTTDVTRTVFIGDKGKISPYLRECFTRVLKGHIQLSSLVFPVNTRSELLDSFARQSLWQAGLDYRHGTGHGVGALLNVHEIPIIGNRKSMELGLQENMIVTIEPGYYENNQFGIRIENCVRTVKKQTKYKYADNVDFLTFEPLTYVPIQRDLIDRDLLNQQELEWLNSYHETCLQIIGKALKEAAKFDMYEWLVEQTKPL